MVQPELRFKIAKYTHLYWKLRNNTLIFPSPNEYILRLNKFPIPHANLVRIVYSALTQHNNVQITSKIEEVSFEYNLIDGSTSIDRQQII